MPVRFRPHLNRKGTNMIPFDEDPNNIIDEDYTREGERKEAEA